MSHNCKEVIAKVFLALDGELSADDEKAFMDDLQKCNCCLDHYNIEKSFKNFLCNKIKKKPVCENLVDKIKSNIQGQSTL